MKKLIKFVEVKTQLAQLQKEFNDSIKELLSQCEDEVCIRITPTYLSHVNKEDGYPVQLHIWNENIIDQPSFPVFGKGIKPL